MASPWASERLIFRAVEETDDAFLSSISNDPEALVNATPFIPRPQGKAAAKGFREWLVSNLVAAIICLPASESTGLHLDEKGTEAEDKKPEPIPIGIIHLNNEDARFVYHRRSEIGINILRKYRSQGYGTEAIQWALRFGFNRCNLHRIAICTFEYNTGARKLYERLGFKPESRLRDFIWHNGRYWDFFGFAMLDVEWRELYDKE